MTVLINTLKAGDLVRFYLTDTIYSRFLIPLKGHPNVPTSKEVTPIECMVLYTEEHEPSPRYRVTDPLIGATWFLVGEHKYFFPWRNLPAIHGLEMRVRNPDTGGWEKVEVEKKI